MFFTVFCWNFLPFFEPVKTLGDFIETFVHAQGYTVAVDPEIASLANTGFLAYGTIEHFQSLLLL